MGKSTAWILSTATVSVAALAVLSLDRQVSPIPQAQAQGLTAESLCPRGNATLRGVYMSRGGGTVIGLGPVAFQGTIYLDGKGGVVNPFTISFAGTISRQSPPGTYVLHSDCSGTMTLGGGAFNLDIRVSPDGNRLDYIQTDPGTVVSGTSSRVSDWE
jgi:hypothetical protein